MTKYLFSIFFVCVIFSTNFVHITSVDSSRVCIVLGENNPCHVDVANPTNVTNFTIAAAKKCKIGHNDITNNEIEFEVTKDHMLAWLNIRKFRRKELKKYIEIQNSKTDGKIKLEITGRCGNEIHQQASNSGGYVSIGSNLLNIFSEHDWKSQIGLESTIDQIIIPEYVWAKLLLIDHAENNGRKKMMILINNMFKYIKKQNGIILFSTPSYKENDRLKILLQFLKTNYSHINTSYILLMPHEGDSKTEPALPYVFNAINALVSIFPPLLSTKNVPTKHQHELCTNSKFCVEKTYVVNLNRRIGRYLKFKDYALKDFGFVENIDYFRFNAIDGSIINMESPTIQSLFRIDKESLKKKRNPYRDHGFRPGVIGCSLSNIAIWFELANRVLANLHYGYQTLTVTLKDFIEHTTLCEKTHTFLVSAITTNITESSDWNEKKKMCIRDNNSKRVYDGFYDQQAVKFSSSISLAVLAYRKKESLIQSLITWNKNGLLNMMSERLIFFQNCPTCKFGKLIDSTQNNDHYTKQIIDLLEKFNFKIIGSGSNVGVGKAMASLVQTASSKNVLFLEEDWQLQSKISNNELHIAQQMLNDKFVHAVKFRSSNNPGNPYCSEVWKGYEHLMLEDSRRGGDGKLSIMNAASWQVDDYKIKQLFGNRIWRCHSNFLCANSYVCGWTNNPTLYSKTWYIENLLEVAKNAHHFESAVNLSPNVWDAKCWVIAQGKGLFTHVDLEKKISEQSPCEIPEIILQQQLS